MIIATTRLETMLGDTGVAIHPDDERFGVRVCALVFAVIIVIAVILLFLSAYLLPPKKIDTKNGTTNLSGTLTAKQSSPL